MRTNDSNNIRVCQIRTVHSGARPRGWTDSRRTRGSAHSRNDSTSVLPSAVVPGTITTRSRSRNARHSSGTPRVERRIGTQHWSRARGRRDALAALRSMDLPCDRRWTDRAGTSNACTVPTAPSVLSISPPPLVLPPRRVSLSELSVNSRFFPSITGTNGRTLAKLASLRWRVNTTAEWRD